MSLQIRVIFTNQSAGNVDATYLDHLIENGKIAAYFIDQWVPVRGKGNSRVLN